MPISTVQDYVDAYNQKAVVEASDISNCLYSVLVANSLFNPNTPKNATTQTLYQSPQELAWIANAYGMASTLAM